MQTNSSAQRERQRKALLFLPVVAVPVVCCIFYSLGGGSKTDNGPIASKTADRFNSSLPDAHFNKRDALVDKLGFYEKADEDSAKRELRMRADPYHSKDGKDQGRGTVPIDPSNGSKMGNISPIRKDTAADRLLEQLDRLKKIVAAPVPTSRVDSLLQSRPDRPLNGSADLSKLEGMMKSIKQTSEEDPQLDRINGLLDKILKIQHPQKSSSDTMRNADSLNEKATVLFPGKVNAEAVYSLDTVSQPVYQQDVVISGFEDIDAAVPLSAMGTVISAVIPEDQQLVSGASLKIRTREDATSGTVTIPKNSLLFGKVAISGERMFVSISSVRVGSNIFSVNLQVFDLDGMAGIRIPGAINREVAKESAGDGVNSLGALGSVDQSLGAQAATAGVQAARSLFSRKLRLVRASVKAGYPVLIKNAKN